MIEEAEDVVAKVDGAPTPCVGNGFLTIDTRVPVSHLSGFRFASTIRKAARQRAHYKTWRKVVLSVKLDAAAGGEKPQMSTDTHGAANHTLDGCGLPSLETGLKENPLFRFGHAKFAELLRNIRSGIARVHLLVDVQNLAILADIKSHATRETACT